MSWAGTGEIYAFPRSPKKCRGRELESVLVLHTSSAWNPEALDPDPQESHNLHPQPDRTREVGSGARPSSQAGGVEGSPQLPVPPQWYGVITSGGAPVGWAGVGSWPRAYFLCDLSFLICKMGIRMVPSL